MELTGTELVLRIVYALAVLGAAWVIGGWAAGLVRVLLNRLEVDPLVVKLIARLVRPLLIVIGFAAALPLLGLSQAATALIAGLGGLLVGVGLAVKDYIADVAAGAVLLTVRPFQAGHSVEVAGRTGSVQEVGLFMTTLATFDGNTVLIPNSKVLAGPMLNLSARKTRRVDVTLLVSRDTDLATAEQAVLDRIAAIQGVLEDPAPAIALGDILATGTQLHVRVWVANEDFAAIGGALRRALHTLEFRARPALTLDA